MLGNSFPCLECIFHKTRPCGFCKRHSFYTCEDGNRLGADCQTVKRPMSLFPQFYPGTKYYSWFIYISPVILMYFSRKLSFLYYYFVTLLKAANS